MAPEHNGYIKLLYTFGVPAVIALMFVVWTLTTLTTALASMGSDHQDQHMLLHAICLNVSQTDIEVIRCNIGSGGNQ